MDVLPPEIARWQYVEERARSILDAFAFREVRTVATAVDAYVAHQRWRREPVTRWYRLGEELTGGLFGLAGAGGEAELVAMLATMAATIAAEGGDGRAPLVAIASRTPGARERLAALGVASEPSPLLQARLDADAGARFEVLLPDGGPLLCAGERRDGLIASLGGPSTPALTFRVRISALVEALPEPAESFEPTLALFVAINGGDAAAERAAVLAHRLRLAGIRTEVEHRPDRTLDEQRTRAAAARARLVLVVTPAGALSLEDLASGAVETLPEAQLETTVRMRMD